MKTLEKNCFRTIRWIDKHLGIFKYDKCHHKVVARVEYESGVTGKLVKKNVCKMHLNSTKKYADRLMRRFQYDVKLKVKLL